MVRMAEIAITLGGSTIAAAAGIDPWCSRIELADRLLRPEAYSDVDDAEAMRWGQLVQPLIFDQLRERGYNAFETPEWEVYNDACSWYVGHPDGVRSDDCIVEAKLTGSFAYRAYDTLPLSWQAQVQTYMHASYYERAMIAVNHRGVHLDVHEVTYDQKAATRLLDLGAEFVEIVSRGEYPPPDGSESARTTLAHIFPKQEPGKAYRLLRDEWDAFKQLREWREAKAKCEERITALENRLKAAAGDAESIISPHDEEVATWKHQTSRRMDTKRLREDHAALAEEYTTESETRVWRVK